MKTWRLIIDGPESGVENMAADEAVLSACSHGASASTIRFYDWTTPTVSIGCFQQAGSIGNACMGEGIPFVRRITGGRAVLHVDEITYSVICCEDAPLFKDGITEAYRTISRCILEALKYAGIHASMHPLALRGSSSGRISCFHSPSRYEIIIDGKKLVGSAQRRYKKAFLQQGSILMGLDYDLAGRLFGEESADMMACISDYTKIAKKDFMSILLGEFQRGLNVNLMAGNFSDVEMDIRCRLVKEKYNNKSWNLDNKEGIGITHIQSN